MSSRVFFYNLSMSVLKIIRLKQRSQKITVKRTIKQLPYYHLAADFLHQASWFLFLALPRISSLID